MFVECEGGSKNGEALMKLGKLMYESHDSCAKNYDCSHPALDQMVQLSNMYGALGARVSQSRYYLRHIEIRAWKIWRKFWSSGRIFVRPV